MKDKRMYLKIACLLEVIYIIIMLCNYLFFTKYGDVVLANIFLLLIGGFFTIVLYNESKKDIEVLKNNRMKIILASIWFLIDPVIPGILGFLFISSISDKNKVNLPEPKEDKNGIKSYVKSLVLISLFILVMFVFPNFKFYQSVPSIVIYVFLVLLVITFYFRNLKNDFIIFIKNFKTYFPFIIKRYFIMLGVMLLVAVPVVLLNNGQTSTNQTLVNAMFKKIPVAALVLSTIYAPFVEESVFRLSLSKLFNNKTLFIIISGVLFGSLHVIDKFTSATDLLYILQYSALGICLAKAYADSKNIFVSISMHFTQNFLAAILVLIVY